MTRFRMFLIGAIAIVGATASLVIEHQAQVKLREADAVLRQQDNQLAALVAEHQRLSNRVAQANSSPRDDRTAELVKLRNEAEALRRQTDGIGKQLEDNRRPPTAQTLLRGDSYLQEHNREYYDPSQSGKIDHAEALAYYFGAYARDHQGQVPSSFHQMAAHLRLEPRDSEHLPQTGTNEFEIVFQGSLNELTNVALRGVAVIRERQARLTRNGKWARLYGYADGRASIVECDDNFQSWEAAHIIPPPSAGQ